MRSASGKRKPKRPLPKRGAFQRAGSRPPPTNKTLITRNSGARLRDRLLVVCLASMLSRRRRRDEGLQRIGTFSSRVHGGNHVVVSRSIGQTGVGEGQGGRTGDDRIRAAGGRGTLDLVTDRRCSGQPL